MLISADGYCLRIVLANVGVDGVLISGWLGGELVYVTAMAI